MSAKKKELPEFLQEKLDDEKHMGLRWMDREKKIFYLAWKNRANDSDWCEEEERIFKDWAEYKDGGDTGKDVKARFRAALGKSTFILLEKHSDHKIYQIVGKDETEGSRQRSGRGSRGRSSSRSPEGANPVNATPQNIPVSGAANIPSASASMLPATIENLREAPSSGSVSMDTSSATSSGNMDIYLDGADINEPVKLEQLFATLDDTDTTCNFMEIGAGGEYSGDDPPLMESLGFTTALTDSVPLLNPTQIDVYTEDHSGPGISLPESLSSGNLCRFKDNVEKLGVHDIILIIKYRKTTVEKKHIRSPGGFRICVPAPNGRDLYQEQLGAERIGLPSIVCDERDQKTKSTLRLLDKICDGVHLYAAKNGDIKAIKMTPVKLFYACPLQGHTEARQLSRNEEVVVFDNQLFFDKLEKWITNRSQKCDKPNPRVPFAFAESWNIERPLDSCCISFKIASAKALFVLQKFDSPSGQSDCGTGQPVTSDEESMVVDEAQ